MNQSKYILALLAALFLFIVGCQDTSSAEESKEQAASPGTTVKASESKPAAQKQASTNADTAPIKAKEMLYAWVDQLNIRDQPNLKGKALTTVDSMEALVFTGVKSEQAETIVLRAVAYHDYWYKVSYADGQEGWVFGGAIKRKGEQKGNAPLTEMQFDYPKFGKYDLSEWKIINIEAMGEELDGESRAYKKGDYFFRITNPSRGEFGYSFTQGLLSDTGKALKLREFNFIPSDTPNEPHQMQESVEDYEQTPPKRYTRIQTIDQHYYDLNAKPMMVRGDWQEQTIHKARPQEQH